MGDWDRSVRVPQTKFEGLYLFLWEPERWDDWFYHPDGIPSVDEFKGEVEATIPINNGKFTINVSGARIEGVNIASSPTDTVDEGAMDSKHSKDSEQKQPSIAISYPDPDSHRFCCPMRLETSVPASALKRVVPTGWAVLFMWTIFLLIAANITTFILGTLPDFEQGTNWDSAFDILEDVSVGIFTLEYIVRMITCVEYTDAETGDKPYSGRWGRLKWCFTDIYALLDLAAILPFWVDLALVDIDLMPTTFLRALRLLRLLKADREADMLSKFDDVLAKIAPALVATGYLGVVMWIIFSTLMYYTERNNEDVGGRMDSIPSSMYFCMQMLMGEFVLNNEFTPAGKVVATCIAIFGAVFFSIPIGLFGGAFLSLAAGDDDEEENEEDEDEEENLKEADEDSSKARAWSQFVDAEGIYLKARALTCYYLSSYGIIGMAISLSILFLIVCSIIFTILDSVHSISNNRLFHQFAIVIEWLCLLICTMELLGRVIDSVN